MGERVVPMNLKWQAHVAQVLHTKMKEWQPSMHIRQVAFLQDSNVSMRIAILDKLIDDCKNNRIEHTKTSSNQSRPTTTPHNPFAPAEWLERDFPINRAPVLQSQIVEYSITAKVFASWLNSQGLTPSEIIQAWFDAFGVAEQVAPKPETTTPEVAPLHAASAAIANAVPVAPDATDEEESQLRGWMKYGFIFAEEISKDKPDCSASRLFDVIRARSINNSESPFSIDEKNKDQLIVKKTESSLKRGTFVKDWNIKKHTQ